MEKERLIKFIATIMEESGFKTTTNYPVDNQVIDIYATLETSVGEVGVVVACKNYEEPWTVGLDVLKDMEHAAKAVNASKILIFTTSRFTHGAAVYAQKRNIKLVDKKGLMKIAQNYSKKQRVVSEPSVDEDEFDYDDYYYESSSRPQSLNPNRGNNSHAIFSGRFSRSNRSSNSSLNQYQSTSYQPRSYINTASNRSISIRDKLPAVDVDKSLTFFKEHMIVYMVLLIIIAAIISLIFNRITTGRYTGLGKIAASAIVCYGGLLLVERNLSELLFKGSIIFFISIIISIVTLTI
ncbi:MAG TPA: restriction endonuclease [Eubacterium sp.]|nr:restriction endonuclease [Eubacterium sp.]HIJ15689.1 restriction endonuclease [Methanosphaera sp.]